MSAEQLAKSFDELAGRLTENTLIGVGIGALMLAIIWIGSRQSFKNRGVEPKTGGEGGGNNAWRWIRWNDGTHLD